MKMRMKMRVALSSLAIGVVTLGGFQNCSSGSLPANAAGGTSSASSLASQAQTGCMLDGSTVISGTTVGAAFSVANSAPGQACPGSQSMSCYNGVWTGSGDNSTGVSIGYSSTTPTTYTAAYSTCQGDAGCTYNGATLASGGTVTAYSASSVAAGSSCDSVKATLTCTDGTMTTSGTGAVAAYTYAACTVAAVQGHFDYNGTVWTPAWNTPTTTYGIPQCGGDSEYHACNVIGRVCWVDEGEYFGEDSSTFNTYICDSN